MSTTEPVLTPATPAAAAPTSTESAPVAAATPPAADWTTGLPDDVKGYVQNKGFKDPGAVLESYRNLEKLIGVKEKLIQLPTKDDDVNAWNEVYNKLGRPSKPEEYKIDAPKQGGDEEFAKWAKNTFHETGLTAKQAEALVAKWAEFTGSRTEAQTQVLAQAAEAQEQALKKEWGAAYDQKIKEGRRAINEFGIGPEMIDKLEGAIGFEPLMKLIANIGSKLAEPEFVTGKAPGFGPMTPEAARQKITSLRSDPEFTRRYLSGGAAERTQMESLHKWASPE